MNKASSITPHDIAPAMVLLLAVASGLIVANLYYAQTLVGPISASTGLSAKAAGLIVTLTQVGYTLGLLFVVPLGDLLENRRLIVTALLVTATALVAAALSMGAIVFLASDAAADVTAQIFAVRGNEIFLMSQSRPIRGMHTAEGWTPETIAERVLPAMKQNFYPLESSNIVFSWDPV